MIYLKINDIINITKENKKQDNYIEQLEIYAEIEKECERGNYELYYRGIISKETTAAGAFEDFYFTARDAESKYRRYRIGGEEQY